MTDLTITIVVISLFLFLYFRSRLQLVDQNIQGLAVIMQRMCDIMIETNQALKDQSLGLAHMHSTIISLASQQKAGEDKPLGERVRAE